MRVHGIVHRSRHSGFEHVTKSFLGEQIEPPDSTDINSSLYIKALTLPLVSVFENLTCKSGKITEPDITMEKFYLIYSESYYLRGKTSIIPKLFKGLSGIPYPAIKHWERRQDSPRRERGGGG